MKKIIKFIIAMILVLLIAILVQLKTDEVSAYSEGLTYTYEDLRYEWNNDGYFIVSGMANKDAYKITIPATLDGYPVKEIRDRAFSYNDNLISVSIPNSIIRIGESTFIGNKGLENIEIPQSVKVIGKEAFNHCYNLKSVKLNEGLENIGASAFNSTNLTSIAIPSSVKFVGASAFAYCESLEIVKLNERLENIGANAFERTNLTSIVIPSSIQYIGVDAFKGDGFDGIFTLYGEKDSIVENYANKYDYIKFIDKDVPFNEEELYTDGELQYRWCYNNNDSYFEVQQTNNKNAHEITIPSSFNGYPVREIRDYAFNSQDNLISITIPDSIVRIGYGAFKNSGGLQKIVIPKSVKIIESDAFESCYNLYSVKLNEGLESIGENAFKDTSLISIIIPASVQSIGINAFEGDGFDGTFTLYGAKNSAAEEYANRYDFVTFIDKDMPFKDVSSNSWYYNAVKYVFGKGIMTGFTETEFAPESNLTRAMFITILYKKEGSPYASTVNNFVDLYKGAYYCSAVTWGVNNNIISGYDSTHFGPDDMITREQIAVILQKYCKYKGQNAKSAGDLTKFSDYAKVSNYAIYGMKWAVGANVITGSNGKLLPQGNATRAEAAAMIQKYCYTYK